MIAAALKKGARMLLPLGVRTSLASWFGRNRWFPGANRWAEGLIRDLKAVDPKRYHKLKWEHHHPSYGNTYEADLLFGSGKLNATRAAYAAFLEELVAAMEAVGMDRGPLRVLDVGCSVGHVLRALETEFFAKGSTLVGVDIDQHAIEAGRRHLEQTDSAIRLMQGDVEALDRLLGTEKFDFVYAAGSLSYLNTEDAHKVVSDILDRTERLAAFVGLANPQAPNSTLEASAFRDDFGSMWTHNFEEMIRGHGSHVVRSRWQAPREGDPQGLYMVFASPTEPASASSAGGSAAAS